MPSLTTFKRAFIAHMAAALAVVPCGLNAQNITGSAQVIDGDTLILDETEIRLFGIDAPELSQPCYGPSETVECGKRAKAELAAMLGDSSLYCTVQSLDRYGRTLAICQISGIDIAQAMVEAGWATAYREFSQAYAASETRARSSKRGIWAWQFQMPSQYRTAKAEAKLPAVQTVRRETTVQSPRQWVSHGKCLIKGNHARNGEWIYHLPGMPYYEATRAEAYFCTEAAAQAAGYRRSRAK